MVEPLLCAHTTIHQVSPTTPWPSNVASISDRLSLPLPVSLGHVDTSQLSLSASKLYQDLRSSLPSLTGDLEESASGATVTDVLDTVLSTVQRLRTLFPLSSSNSRPVTSLVSDLVGVLTISCFKDTVIISDVPYLLARSLPSKDLEALNFEGHAILLACAAILAEDSVRSSSSDDHMVVDQSEQSNESMPSFGGSESQSEDAMQVSVSGSAAMLSSAADCPDSLSTVVDLGVPFDAHVLPGHGRRTHCLLPALGVADNANVNTLVASLLFQRHIWGISLPTVGISLSIAGTSVLARIVIGWLEENGSDRHLPAVHLATAIDVTTQDPANGVFNLLEPLQALVFSQFILGFASHFQTLSLAMIMPSHDSFCWRADRTVLAYRTLNSCCIEPMVSNDNCYIGMWRENLSFSGCSDAIIADRMSKGTVKSGSESIPQLQLPLEEQNKSTKAKSTKSKSTQSKSDKSAYSASEYAALNPPELDSPSTELWLRDRSTIPIGRYILFANRHLSDTEAQINKMISLYNQVTQFEWPKTWQNKKNMPQGDKIYSTLAQQLWDQYQQFTEDTSHMTSPENIIHGDEAAFQSVTNNISALFQIVSIAQAREKQSERNISVPEAEMRQPWDSLLMAFCCDENTMTSDNIFFERMIDLPANKSLSKPSTIELAKLERDICLKEIPAASEEDDNKVALSLAAATSALARHAYIEEQTSNPGFNRMEPHQAKADAVLAINVVINGPNSSTSNPLTSESTLFSLIKSLFRAKSSGSCDKSAQEVKFGNTIKRSAHLKCSTCPHITQSLLKTPAVQSSSLPAIGMGFENILTLALFFAEYKRDADEVQKAFHQCEMYCISGVEFLAALGIYDFPVFGLVTSGTRGSVLMAWKWSGAVEGDRLPRQSTLDTRPGARHNFLIRRNLVSFDLTKPLEAFHCILTIHRIFQRHSELIRRVKEIDGIERIALDPAFDKWKMKPSNGALEDKAKDK